MSRRGVIVIGAGVVGEMRAATIRDHPETDLTGVADVDLTRARQVAGAGVTAVDDYRRLLETPAVEVAVVSTPVHCHEEIVVAALQAGLHVLVEKPLSNSVESGSRMVETADAAGKVMTVGFNHRYYPSFRWLKQVVDDGQLGPIDHVRAFGGHEGMTQFRAPWMYERDTLGGGAMMDVGIHVADLIQYLGFHAYEVTARLTNGVWRITGSEDNAMVIATTKSGVSISYHATWSEWKGYRLRVEVYGRHGMALGFYPPLLNLLWRRADDGTRRRSWVLHTRLNLRERFRGWEVTARDAFAAELTDFLKLLDGKPGACATGLDGLRAVQFAEAATRSSEHREMVILSDG